MSDPIFSKDEQMRLLIDGKWHESIMKLHPEIAHASHAVRYLTVRRADVLEYFKRNPALARMHLEKWEAYKPQHDVFAVWHENGAYKVAIMDHGTPRDVTVFKSMEEAVANHFCLVCAIPL